MTRRTDGPPSARTRVKRYAKRGAYDRATLDAILDAGLIAHVGFVHDGQPYVTPTLHARVGDRLYLHGSSASRTLRDLAKGIPVCVTVTLLDGVVFARSIFEHSINYRSVMVLGVAHAVTDPEEKRTALQALSEQLLPGRWGDVRPPTATELKATSVLSLAIEEASAKIRTDGPDDDGTPDAELEIWAGHVPLVMTALAPVPAAGLRPGIPTPAYAADYRRAGLTA